MSSKIEYNASSTNAVSCYSNVEIYGSEGRTRPIIPPTPATVQPALFNIMRPHKIPLPKTDLHYKLKCGPYMKLSELQCNSDLCKPH